MNSALVTATADSGGGLAMIGIFVLIGAVAGLIYLVRGRR
jgi:hypothetical protein